MGVGRIINKLRVEQGFSVQSLARATGVPPSTLDSVIKRDSESMNILDLQRIAKCLGVDLDFFHDQLALEFSAQYADHSSNTSNLQVEMELAERESIGQLEVLSSEEEGGCMKLEPEHRSFLRQRCHFLRVGDESMLPEFHLGDIVVFVLGEEPEIGELGVFRWNEKFHVRCRHVAALVASNPYYAAHNIDKDTRCLGRVVGNICLDKGIAVRSQEKRICEEREEEGSETAQTVYTSETMSMQACEFESEEDA